MLSVLVLCLIAVLILVLSHMCLRKRFSQDGWLIYRIIFYGLYFIAFAILVRFPFGGYVEDWNLIHEIRMSDFDSQTYTYGEVKQFFDYYEEVDDDSSEANENTYKLKLEEQSSNLEVILETSDSIDVPIISLYELSGRKTHWFTEIADPMYRYVITLPKGTVEFDSDTIVEMEE